MTLSMDTAIIIQQVYVYVYAMLRMYVFLTVCMCLCQLASIHIVQCLSIKLLSAFGQIRYVNNT